LTRAETRVARSLEEHAGVRALVEALGPAGFGTLRVEMCGASMAAPGTVGGGFVPPGPRGEPAEMVVCAETVDSQRAVDAVMVHELVHAYDHCRGVAVGVEGAPMAWDDVREHACSEIRAARLSGDCRPLEELRRGNWPAGLVSGEDNVDCIRRRAALSVAMNPAASPSLGRDGRPDAEGARRVAREAVDDVFHECYADTRPFRGPQGVPDAPGGQGGQGGQGGPAPGFAHAPSPSPFWDPTDWNWNVDRSSSGSGSSRP